MIFRNVLSGGVTGSINFWGRDLGLVIGDVLEAGGGTCGIPKSDNGAEVRAAEGQDLANFGSREVYYGSGNPVPGSIY